MSNPKLLLTKMCSQCRQIKPLSAFSKMTQPSGTTTFGNICIACQKIAKQQPNPANEEGSESSSTGLKIDSKTKVREDADKKQHREHVDQLYHEDREKDYEQQIKDKQKTISIAKEERKHREGFLEKRSFLETQDKAKSSNPTQVFGGEAHKAKEREIRLDAPIIDTQPKEKYGAIWRQFKDLLGTSAVGFGKEKKSTLSIKKQNDEKQIENEKKSLEEFVEKNWTRPGSKKR